MITFVVYLAVTWWATWYPGSEPGGGGFVAQRMLSARSERDSLLATLWFSVAHYALRPWPWILTALCSLVLYPTLVDKESGFIKVIVDPQVFPPALRGLMIAAFAAAYMSTIGTHLNWGASYLVNDVYRRFLRKGASEKHYVLAARLTTVLLFLASIVVTLNLGTIAEAWLFLLALGSGTGLVLILRWYWWRINAWSEISAMGASMAVSLVAMWWFKRPGAVAEGPGAEFEIQAKTMLVTVVVSTVVWLAVTFLTKPEPDEKLRSFYDRVRPGGPGWARVSTAMGLGREGIPGGALSFANWGLAIVLVYSALFGIGKVILGATASGLGLLALAAVCFAAVMRNLRR